MFFLFTFCDCHWLIPWLLPFLLGLIFGMRYAGNYRTRISELEANRSKNSNRIIALEEDLNSSQRKLNVTKEDINKSRQRLTQVEAELALAKGKLYEIEEAEEIAKQAPTSTALKTSTLTATAVAGFTTTVESIGNIIETKSSDTTIEKLPEIKSFKELEAEEFKGASNDTAPIDMSSQSSEVTDSVESQNERIGSEYSWAEESRADIEDSTIPTVSDSESTIDEIKQDSNTGQATEAIEIVQSGQPDASLVSSSSSEPLPESTISHEDQTIEELGNTDLTIDDKFNPDNTEELGQRNELKSNDALGDSSTDPAIESKQELSSSQPTSLADSLNIASASAVVGIGNKKEDVKTAGEADFKRTKKKKAKSGKKKKSKDQKKKSIEEESRVTKSNVKKKKKKIDSGFRLASSGRFQKIEDNDLSVIEGIGPKTEELLQQNGITSWAELSTKTPSELKDILAAAGSRFSHLDPSTWTRQANLAAGNHWTRLEKLQDKLDGGKVKTASKADKKGSKTKAASNEKKGKQKGKSIKSMAKSKKLKKTSVVRATQNINVGSVIKESNLEVIEGVGPKMNALLNKEGIKSWTDLSSHSPGEIRTLLDKYGDRYRIIDVKLWPKQATYAAKGQWSKLIDFQKSDGSASKAEKVLTKAGVFKSSKVDDLKLIEGIGPKTEKVLHKAGIKNWTTLSKTTSTSLTEIMTKAGKRFAFVDTSTWTKQAALAASGKFDQLEKLQQKL